VPGFAKCKAKEGTGNGQSRWVPDLIDARLMSYRIKRLDPYWAIGTSQSLARYKIFRSIINWHQHLTCHRSQPDPANVMRIPYSMHIAAALHTKVRVWPRDCKLSVLGAFC
jgi:hypothetical protein